MKKLAEKTKGKLPKWLTGPLRRTWDILKRKVPKFLRDFVSSVIDKLKSKIQDQIKKFVKDNLKRLLKELGLLGNCWKDFLEWITSIDPVSRQLKLSASCSSLQSFISALNYLPVFAFSLYTVHVTILRDDVIRQMHFTVDYNFIAEQYMTLEIEYSAEV